MTIDNSGMLIRKRTLIASVSVLVLIAGYISTVITDKQRTNTEYITHIETDTLAHATNQHSDLRQSYAQLPLQFEQNRGQTNDEVEFISRGSGYTLFLTPTETLLTLKRSTEEGAQSSIIRTTFVNANIPVEFDGKNILDGKVNYLIGHDKTDWITNIPTYADVIAEDIYPGIDLRYHGDQRQLEYDFIVSPGVNADIIQIQFDGIDNLQLNKEGDLVLHTEQGELQHKKPTIYQDINGKHIDIEGSYLLADNNVVSFKLGTYDPEYALIIDPVLDYSTYLGGNKRDEGIAVAVDDEGNAYVIGTTKSKDDFPVVNPIQSMIDNKEDVFISKLSADGSTLIYSTYLGGKKDDIGKDIAVDSDGHAYLIGDTESDDFPLYNAYQSNDGQQCHSYDDEEGDDDQDCDDDDLDGKTDAFIAKLSIDGSALVFSTYFGGDEEEEGTGIAVDDFGDVYFTGKTKSKENENFPLLNAIQPDFGGKNDAYIAKFSSDGSTLLFSTYLGGNKDEESRAIALDSFGGIYITGKTKSMHDFPLVNSAQSNHGGQDDGFVAKLSSDGSTLLYSTYLGGDKDDEAKGIAVNANGEAIVTGKTKSKENQNFPIVNAIQPEHGGKDDAFISKLSVDGAAFFTPHT